MFRVYFRKKPKLMRQFSVFWCQIHVIAVTFGFQILFGASRDILTTKSNELMLTRADNKPTRFWVLWISFISETTWTLILAFKLKLVVELVYDHLQTLNVFKKHFLMHRKAAVLPKNGFFSSKTVIFAHLNGYSL